MSLDVEHHSFTVRNKCIFCESTELNNYFIDDISTPVASYTEKEPSNSNIIIPYNIQRCESCKTFQNKYLGNLSDVYSINHASPYGKISMTKYIEFTKFINTTIGSENITGIYEIGAGSGALADNILKEFGDHIQKYYIVDPHYFGSLDKKEIVHKYAEEFDHNELIGANTVIMSHVFEHFYEPLKILTSIMENKNVEYICLDFPDLEGYIQNKTFNFLHIEHTYFAENNFIIQLFNKYGFTFIGKQHFAEHSVFFTFKRYSSSINNELQLINNNSEKMITSYFDNLYNTIKVCNSIITSNPQVPAYIWPCSVHSQQLLIHGLSNSIIAGFLDNSPLKIGTYMYGYQLCCDSFNNLIEGANSPTIIILSGGCFNQEIIDSYNKNKNIIFINTSTI